MTEVAFKRVFIGVESQYRRLEDHTTRPREELFGEDAGLHLEFRPVEGLSGKSRVHVHLATEWACEACRTVDLAVAIL